MNPGPYVAHSSLDLFRFCTSLDILEAVERRCFTPVVFPRLAFKDLQRSRSNRSFQRERTTPTFHFFRQYVLYDLAEFGFQTNPPLSYVSFRLFPNLLPPFVTLSLSEAERKPGE